MEQWTSNTLQQLYKQFCDIIQKVGDKNICFIVDDLSVLIDVTEQPRDILAFIKYCRTLISDKVL